MYSRPWFSRFAFSFVAALAIGSTGCVDISGEDLEDIIEELGELFDDANIDLSLTDDPRTLILPDPIVDRGDTVIINNNVTIIDDLETDLIVEELPDITLLVFDNFRLLDAFYIYLADGVEQQVFIPADQPLALEYPCLGSVQLVFEEYYDPVTGELVESFDIDEFDGFFENPADFGCGEALIFEFDDEGIQQFNEPIDLENPIP